MARGFLIAAMLASCVPVAALGETSLPPYHIIRTVKAGGGGGFDYVYADSAERRLYIARSGKTPPPRITVFNLDTLEAAGQIDGFSAHGAAVESGRGFATSKPVVMWDAATLATIKPIEVSGNPDGILADPYTHRIYVLSHSAPNVTVLNALDGAIVGTIDLSAAPEQAVLDGKGHLFVDLEDKAQVAVVDTASLSVTGRYDLGEKGGTPAGLALDPKSRVLFVACRNPANMVMLDADTGRILDAIPIGTASDGAAFNPETKEAFSSQADGTLSIIKETGAKRFVLEQTLTTQPTAKTLTLDRKTGHIFLIAAQFEPPPPDAPVLSNGRVARGPMVPDSFSILEVGR
jgi:DNA-binding beta-propeller fold protein YncE